MKKWHDINKRNFVIACIIAVVGFSFALFISISVPGDSVKSHIIRVLALLPLFLGADLIWSEITKDKRK